MSGALSLSVDVSSGLYASWGSGSQVSDQPRLIVRAAWPAVPTSWAGEGCWSLPAASEETAAETPGRGSTETAARRWAVPRWRRPEHRLRRVATPHLESEGDAGSQWDWWGRGLAQTGPRPAETCEHDGRSFPRRAPRSC